MRRALPDDIPTLLALMTEFYAESGYALDKALAEHAFTTILADDRLGYIWIFDHESRDVGYVVVTLRFGMEYGGTIACLDDLFVVPRSRNHGLAKAALLEVREFCKTNGIRAITVEVGDDNKPAQALYRGLGLVEAPGRQLLAMALAPPAHAV